MSMNREEVMRLLARGTDEAIEEAIDSPFSLVVEWTEAADEVFALVKEMLGEDFDYEPLDDALGRFRVRLADREDEIEITNLEEAAQEGDGGNGIELLWPLAMFLEPDYRLYFFRDTLESDTICAMIQPADWWDEFRKRHARKLAEIFADPEEAEEIVGSLDEDYEDEDEEDDEGYDDEDEEEEEDDEEER